MARVALVLAALSACLLTQTLASDVSSSELYTKLRAILKDRRVQEVAKDVERDLREERENLNDDSRLMEELREAERPVDEDKLESRRQLSYGDNFWKRMLEMRAFTIEKEPWYSAKPKKEDYDSSCYMLQDDKRYQQLWLYECEYYIKQKDTKECKEFCRDWQRNAGTTDECPYDNKFSEDYCKFEAKKRGCEITCSRGRLTGSSCCGYCARPSGCKEINRAGPVQNRGAPYI